MRVAKLISVTAVIFLTLSALTAQQKNPLTNADVIKMVKSGLAETTIAAAIAANASAAMSHRVTRRAANRIRTSPTCTPSETRT